VAREQLAGLGVSADAIEGRLRRRRLHRVHQGVYAVGAPSLTARGRWMAAVLAAGPGAALGHRSAAALWDLRPSASARLEVIARRSVARPRIEVHVARLQADEMTTLDRIPVTSVHRTLLDLASVLTPPQLERALERAEALRLADPVPLAVLVERHRGARGMKTLRRLLHTEVRPVLTRTEREDLFLDFLAAHGLPKPEVNVDIELSGGWIQADFLWRDRRLIVELDDRQSHDTGRAFERDRARDRVLATRGWRVVRVTLRQLRATPAEVARDLAALLRP
jgi:hypothetical protein